MPCNKLITDKQIIEHLTIPHTDNNKIIKCVKGHFRCRSFDTNQKEAFFNLKKGAQQLLDKSAHWTYESKSKTTLENIRLTPDHLKSDIGKKLIKRSKHILGKYGFKTLKLKATYDGVIAWRRIGFEYETPEYETAIIESFGLYISEVKPQELPIKEYKTLKNIELDLFYDDKIDFTDWLADKKLHQGYMMTMDINHE